MTTLVAPKVLSRNSQSFRKPSGSNNKVTAPTSKKPRVSFKPANRISQNSTPVGFDDSISTKEEMTGGRGNSDRLSNLTVAVRIRPINSRELANADCKDVIKVDNKQLIIQSDPTAICDSVFLYDHIFCSGDQSSSMCSSQEDVFLAMGKPLLDGAFKGYNACLFAYGQTGSGKSFSMMGKNDCDVIDVDSAEYSGVIPRFCRDLFDRISNLNANISATVEVSYFEIYNEKIHDLLLDPNAADNITLKVREHPQWGPYVENLSVYVVESYEELRDWLLLGNSNRSTSATNMNEKSSRSHSIFTIQLSLLRSIDSARIGLCSKVNLVDLAGSERLNGPRRSEEQIRQSASINKSLFTLGKVISCLASHQRKSQFVPYRESVLTWLLKESLGGNSLTSMLATITPSNTHLDETLATLRYACQARSIVNRVRINENPQDRMIRELRQEVQRLRTLKMNYEWNSVLNRSSATQTDNAVPEEVLELRSQLQEAERKLQDIDTRWVDRLIEMDKARLDEWARSESRRAFLECKLRIVTAMLKDLDVSLTPYTSDFLEELKHILSRSPINGDTFDFHVDNLIKWCRESGLKYTIGNQTFIIVDAERKKRSFVHFNDIYHDDKNDFLNSLTWIDFPAHSETKLRDSDIKSCISQIYQVLGILQPRNNDQNLSLSFAELTRSVRSFEAAVLKIAAAENGPGDYNN